MKPKVALGFVLGVSGLVIMIGAVTGNLAPMIAALFIGQEGVSK